MKGPSAHGRERCSDHVRIHTRAFYRVRGAGTAPKHRDALRGGLGCDCRAAKTALALAGIVQKIVVETHGRWLIKERFMNQRQLLFPGSPPTCDAPPAELPPPDEPLCHRRAARSPYTSAIADAPFYIAYSLRTATGEVPAVSAQDQKSREQPHQRPAGQLRPWPRAHRPA